METYVFICILKIIQYIELTKGQQIWQIFQ